MERMQMSIAMFHEAIKLQCVEDKLDIAFICPICKRVQSPRDLIDAGAGKTFDDVERFVGFSCVGRWLGAGSFRMGEDNANGCDWTLGGFFQLHDLEVVDDDGGRHPRFKPASPKQAKEHANRKAKT